jgi:hypothetical protein
VLVVAAAKEAFDTVIELVELVVVVEVAFAVLAGEGPFAAEKALVAAQVVLAA